MTLPHDGDQSRWDAARAAIQDASGLLAQPDEQHYYELFRFDEELRPSDLEDMASGESPEPPAPAAPGPPSAPSAAGPPGGAAGRPAPGNWAAGKGCDATMKVLSSVPVWTGAGLSIKCQCLNGPGHVKNLLTVLKTKLAETAQA